MKIIPVVIMAGSVILNAQEGGNPRGGPAASGPNAIAIMQASPILNAIDKNHDNVISGAELAASPDALRSLDKNRDGKVTPDEVAVVIPPRGGEQRDPPIAGPSADELSANLLRYDKNKGGRLQKSELSERMQGMLTRGDLNKDGMLDAAEIRKLAVEQATASPGGRGQQSVYGRMNLVADTLDADHDGEISASEIENAPAALKILDRNNDGQITEDEARPAGGRGPGRG